MDRRRHTEGPWQVIGEKQTEVAALLDTPNAIVIADTRFFQEPTNPNEKWDAQLIAAGPELLDVAFDERSMECIYLSEIQRLCGPDIELSYAAQSSLHALRVRREQVIAKALGATGEAKMESE